MSAIQILNEAIQQKKVVLDSEISFTPVGSNPIAWIASVCVNGYCHSTDVHKTKQLAREKLAEVIISTNEIGSTRRSEKEIFKQLQGKSGFRVEYVGLDSIVIIFNEGDGRHEQRIACPFNSLQAEVIRHTVQNQTAS